MGQDGQHLLMVQAAALPPLPGPGQGLQPFPGGQEILPAAEIDQLARGLGQVAHIGAAAGAAADHHHRRVMGPGPGGDQRHAGQEALQPPDQGHPVIAGVTAAAVAHADLSPTVHDGSG